jgi:hypothetical protein
MDSQHYQSISYEALVTDCESECRSLAEFLAVLYDPKMPRYYEGHTRPREEGSANDVWLPPTPGLRDWRTQMDRDELERFESAAGAFLQHIGYELGCARVSDAARQRAERAKQAFTIEAHQRNFRLPESW